MKKLRALASFLAISLGIGSSSLYATASVINVPVVHDAWTFIGVPGFQSYGATTGSSGTSGYDTSPSGTSATIVDGAGSTTYTVAGLEVPTWDGNVTHPVSSTTAAVGAVEADGLTPRPATSGSGVGSNIYGTVGLMVIGDSTSGAHTSTTDHAGVQIAGMSFTQLVNDDEAPVRTMYIQSANAAAPDVKVYYQATYEGNTFYLKITTSTSASALVAADTIYVGTFDKDYTYDEAAVLGTDFLVETISSGSGTSGTDVSGVTASFDMDLSDNNMSSTKNDITASTATNSLRAALDGNMTVLTWDAATQSWLQARFSGTGTSSTVTAYTANDFTSFTQGKGYWVKVEPSANFGGATYDQPSGFVLGYDAAADINHSTFIADGWNMLNFGDEYLAYSTTGILLTAGAQELNITDTYGSTTLNVTIAGTRNEDDCAAVNKALDDNSSFRYTNFALRCIPTDSGLALLSTRRFTIQAGSAVTALNGAALTAENNGSAANFYRSQYGVHAMIIEPNTYFNSVTGADGNMSVEFPVEQTNTTQYAAVTTVANTETSLDTAIDAAISDTDAANEVTQLDMNFDGTTDALLVSSNFRFFIKDATLVRIFDYRYGSVGTSGNSDAEGNLSIRIVGAALTTGQEAEGNLTVWDDNLSGTVLRINEIAEGAAGLRTEVNATKLEGDEDNTTMMLYYTGALQSHTTRLGYIDLEEWASGYDLFEEQQTDTNATTKGSIARVWQIRHIAETIDVNSSGEYDGNYSGKFTSLVTSDAKYNAIFADDFPVDGPLFSMVTDYGVQPEVMITGQTEAGGTPGSSTLGTYISWKQIDVTKDTDEWYDDDDQFELFWTEKEKGYWVYIDGASTNSLSFDTPTLNGTVDAHFNNYFASGSSVGTTRNHLNHTLTVVANGLTTVGQANSNTDSFELYATIGGALTSFQRSSQDNTFTIPIDSHETNGLSFDDGEVTITITSAKGNGEKASTIYTLDYEKPVISSVTLSSATATVSITNGTSAAGTIHVYSGDINDSSYGTSTSTNWAGSATVAGDTTDVNLGAMSALAFPTSFENNATAYIDSTTYNSLTEQIDEGLIRDVRFTAQDAMNSTTLYSDQYRLYYVPIYNNSGILSSSDNTESGWDSTPAVYGSDGEDNTTAWQAAQDADNQPYDDGVQLKTAVNGTTITCAYAHQSSVQLDETTPITKTVETPTGGDVGIIIYNPAYEGRPFYCQVSGVLYVGAFIPESQQGDITMQQLSSSVTGVSIVKP